jgi:hypothetical protein
VNLVDKIRNLRYQFLLTESLSRSPKGGREDEEVWLFETLVSQPARASRGERAIFLLTSPVTH